MNTRNYLAPLVALVLALGAVLPLQAGGPPKPKVLLDFTEQDSERNGVDVTVKKRYGYAYEQWNGKITFLEGRGLLIPCVANKGGFGGDKSMKLSDYGAVELAVVIGNQNAASAFGITLIDADGTEATWYLTLAGKPRGTDQVYRLDLAKRDKEEKPGSTPGLDKTKIKKWQIKGNWQEAKIEVLVVKLTAVP